MGVPVFFKWLSTRNPRILLDAAQSDPDSYQSGNPHVDNFYVDMNGLIHPSVNPKGQNIKVPKNFQQQIQNIQLYMDKIMNIVRPKKLLYMAIDGVAPRAKMNQQRSRRFRAAMQGQQSRKQKQKLYQEYKKMQITSGDIEEYVYKQSFDSNLITPGTTFLRDVAQRLRQYIKNKLSTDKLWKNLTVIFSDANCPGQGQHKIMEFIRQQRATPHYNPNMSHCIYGADADLIMLALATHQPRFYIIRQVVVTANDKWCTTCGKKGHFFIDCTVANSIQDQMKVAQKLNADSIGVTFQFIKIKGVRQFLHVNYQQCTFAPSFSYDLQRVIDDFVFICFFVGNDFLPHNPCLSIRDGGIDVLMRVYEYCLKVMPDYITNIGHINMKSLRIFIKELSSYEQELIGQLINKENNQKQRENFEKNVKPNMIKNLEENNPKFQKQLSKQRSQQSHIDPHDLLGSFKQQIKKRITPQINLQDYSSFNHQIYSYKQKYYAEKFRIQPKQFLQLKSSISKKYLEALQWVCRYYYESVPSWDWFYPFHYSPFLSDIDVPIKNTVFEIGRPFKPFEQLMGVFPPKTYYALPECLQPLMLDLNSPICDYFPSQFVIDIVGKKFAWLGEVLLPFIDSKRLLAAMGNYEQKLNEQQRQLNKLGNDYIYISRYGQLGRILSNTEDILRDVKIVLKHEDHNISGQISLNSEYTDTYEFRFKQPSGHTHDIKLKNGIQYNPLEEISSDFISRTDKRSYGGERFVRVIQKSLGKRVEMERRKSRFSQNKRQEQRYDDRDIRQPRERSRDFYRRNNDYRGNNEYRGNNQYRDQNQQYRRDRYDNNRSNDPRNNQYQQQSGYSNNRYNNNQGYQNQQYSNNNQYQNPNYQNQYQNPNYQRQNYQMQNQQQYQQQNRYPNNSNSGGYNNNNSNQGYNRGGYNNNNNNGGNNSSGGNY